MNKNKHSQNIMVFALSIATRATVVARLTEIIFCNGRLIDWLCVV